MEAMGRPPRMYAEGIYHVAAHGSDVRDLFLDDRDRRVFLDLVGLTFAPLGLRLISYVLMTNHHHLLVDTPDDRIARGLQQLHGGFARIHNARHGRTAHLFRAHPIARRVEDDGDLIWTDRYIAWNPVGAGIVATPFDWPWSSALTHAGLAAPALPLHESELRAAFGAARDWRRRYFDYVSAALNRAA